MKTAILMIMKVSKLRRVIKAPDKLKSSFRDPSGFLFTHNDALYRQINTCYKNDYDLFEASGLYDQLVNKKYLVSHQETTIEPMQPDCYKVIKPELIPFISYPYEWSFEQLKQAALLTLNIQKIAIGKGMSLKDASAYNIQFINGSPIFIDTLSFECYDENKPWVAYKQFCQHFLAPLCLMLKVSFKLNELSITNIDGIPLDLASKLLPISSYFSPLTLLHIHLHASQQKKSAADSSLKNLSKNKFSMHSMLAILDSLSSGITSLKWRKEETEWNDYYTNNNNYSSDSISEKETKVKNLVSKVSPSTVWDFGANDGKFSRVASIVAEQVISWDIDHSCVQRNYINCIRNNDKNILPLLLDLSNPSPSIGWGNTERPGLMERGGCDLILSLGLIHHLAISNNLPLELIAETFSKISTHLIIEWVPKEDSQVIKLLSTRADIFDNYTQTGFEESFMQFYSVLESDQIEGSHRILYLLESKCV